MLMPLIHLAQIWKSAVDRPEECEITGTAGNPAYVPPLVSAFPTLV
jgi:hypothetical protein